MYSLTRSNWVVQKLILRLNKDRRGVGVMRDILAVTFKRVWIRETSAFPERWSPANPAYGQCLATSWVAKQYLGGQVIQAVFTDRPIVHFWNVLPSGEKYDFTDSQFQGEFIPWHNAHCEILTSELFGTYCKIFPGVADRYGLFTKRFYERLPQLA